MAAGNTQASLPLKTSGRPVTPDWQRWIAENILLGNDLHLLIEAMCKNGFDRETAVRELAAAQNHPYVAAAQAIKTGATAAPAVQDNQLKKRDWVLEIYRRTARLATTFGTVPRVRKPSRQEFLDHSYARNEPVVLEGVMDDWPALTRWTPAYFKERLGERMVEVQAQRTSDANYEINKDKLCREMRFGDYVDLVESIGSSNDYYITAKNSGKNKDSLRELWDDIPACPEYLRDDPQERGFFWYGPQDTVTPLHHDLTNNFMAQIRGRKLIRLIAAYELADVYNHLHCFSQVDLDHIDYDKFPRFRNVRVIDVVIGPGDLFFLPVGWWHYVRALDISITMTFTNFILDNDFFSFYTTYQQIY
jgi:cupin-like protein